MRFNINEIFNKKNSSKMPLISVVGVFWHKIYKIVLFIFLVCMFIFGGYVWETSLSGGEWNNVKKQAFLDAQSKGVVLKENDFKKVFADIEMRKQASSGDHQKMRDIFKAY